MRIRSFPVRRGALCHERLSCVSCDENRYHNTIVVNRPNALIIMNSAMSDIFVDILEIQEIKCKR